MIDGLIVKPLKINLDHRGYLVETWRSDSGFHPEMMYLSYSKPGIRRGAHLHHYQTDCFAFVGPGDFRVVCIDNRKDSSTYLESCDIYVGEHNPSIVIIPPNIWHGYQNVSDHTGMVINLPDKLYRGFNYTEPVDEERIDWAEIYNWPEITN